MISPQAESDPAARSLAILDHRGEQLVALRSRLQDRGWRILSARSPHESASLLDEQEVHMVLVAPLTLTPESAEWELLLPRLSPRAETPWLVLPWEGAAPGRLGGLLREEETIADWLPAPFAADEAEARVAQLMRWMGWARAQHRMHQQLRDQLIEDHKTGLSNDRHFRSRLAEEFSRSQRHGGSMGVLLIDIDNFKSINDNASYEFGDTVLRSVAEVLRHSVRNIDLPARIGGDEFGVLMPHTNLEESVGVAKRILSTSAGLVVHDEEFHAEVGLSIGAAAFDGQGLTDATQLFLRANDALKSAKAAGKGKVSFFDPMLRAPSSQVE